MKNLIIGCLIVTASFSLSACNEEEKIPEIKGVYQCVTRPTILYTNTDVYEIGEVQPNKTIPVILTNLEKSNKTNLEKEIGKKNLELIPSKSPNSKTFDTFCTETKICFIKKDDDLILQGALIGCDSQKLKKVN